MTDGAGRPGHGHAGHPPGEHEGGHAHLQHVPDAARAAVYAARAAVVFRPPSGGRQLETAVDQFLAALSEGLAGAGCTLVGHIKGFLAADQQGELAFHATVLDAAPAVTGGFAGAVEEAALTINVIVFGVVEQTLPAIVQAAWSRASGAETVWRG